MYRIKHKSVAQRVAGHFAVRVKKVEDTALNDSIEAFSYLDFLYLNSRILRSSWQHARLDQWLDRFLYTEKVTGSNPVSSIFFCPPLPLPAFSRPWAIFRSNREVHRTNSHGDVCGQSTGPLVVFVVLLSSIPTHYVPLG